MRKVRGVILDIDGTLIDSNDVITQAWVEAIKESGYNVQYDEVRKLIGMGADNLLPRVTGQQKESPQGKQMSERWREIFEEKYLPHLKAFPKAQELVQRMHDQGLKLMIGSSAQAKHLDKLLEIIGIKDLIDAKTTSDDAKHSKPDPDIIGAALSKSGLNADEIIMLGDTPYDIEAASQVQIGTIALRCGGWNTAGLVGALAHYDDPADLLAQYEDSLLVKGMADSFSLPTNPPARK